MTNPADLDIVAAGRALREGRMTSQELVAATLDRIVAHDPALHCFIHIDGAAALAAASTADAELQSGLDRGPMHGIPYALKDIFDAEGVPTTCHSRVGPQGPAVEDSHVAARFRAGGAILLGKLATYEFALGGPSFDLPFPPARNPWDPTRLPGGSSSGSAAAVAAGFMRVATGSCTAGSIRGPAAWCGVVGVKPTFGRVSCRGVFPLAPSLDHCGPIARSVSDAAVALQLMAGHDPRDPGSAARPVPDFRIGLENGVSGLRVGVLRSHFAHDPGLSIDARDGIERTIECIRSKGAEIADVALPDYALFHSCNRVIMTAEMFAIHREQLQRGFSNYGEITARRFVSGAIIGAADYLAAQRLRRTLTEAVDAALEQHDVLLTAISLATAPAFDPPPIAFPVQPAVFNVSGHPATSVPIGFGYDGLPLAVQIAARPFDEMTMLRVCRTIERCSSTACTEPQERF